MKSTDIRTAFLQYFEQRGHQQVASSSLLPENDPSLLFVNAGMVPFKEVFLGHSSPPHQRVVSAQRCIRAGGKHNDLENVGYTARHHTFFEMLGNFSFGDYFKREAIAFAWEFLTDSDYLGIAIDKLLVTVYIDDQEAYDIWKNDIGVAEERIIRIGDQGGKYVSDNFWSMGDIGPCGPCTEIFYDHGPQIAGGPPGSADEDGDRFIEIWNIVFMQFNRDGSGQMTNLPKPSVDTGMGLERIAAVMQGVHSNYDIDLFQHLLTAAAQLLNISDTHHSSLRVIADHIRACAFLIADGILPGNEGRGYVLRRLIRRAVRHGNKLGASDAFFYQLVAPLVAEMGDAYPLLTTSQKSIEQILLAEEQQFAKTLDQGLKILEQDLSALTGNEIPGEIIFKLYDTYGFPIDLTADIAREYQLSLDYAGFDHAMAAQRERARHASHFKDAATSTLDLKGSTAFTGYDQLHDDGTVVALLKDDATVATLRAGEQGTVILSQTPFYAESGGQVGDCGVLQKGAQCFTINSTSKSGDHHLHHGVMTSGELHVGDTVAALVDSTARRAIACNHSATHLLHAALRQILGEHVTQQGSLVDAQKLRFDFAHPQVVSVEQLQHIETLVNEQIRNNSAVTTTLTDLDDAKARGAMMLFGEKYDNDVRLLDIAGGFSVELCGGTHVQRTGDIGLFKIVSESGIAAGVRRIEARTGKVALDFCHHTENQLNVLAAQLKTAPDNARDKLQQLLQDNKQLTKQHAQLQAQLAAQAGADLGNQAEIINGVAVLATTIEADVNSLRGTVDQLKNKLGSAIIVLTCSNDNRVSIIVGISKDLTDRFNANDLIKPLAAKLGGKGGGRADMAQGGGSDIAALPATLQWAKQWVRERLTGE